VAEVRDYEEDNARFDGDYNWEDAYEDAEEEEASSEEDEGGLLFTVVAGVDELQEDGGEGPTRGRAPRVQLDLLGPQEVRVAQGGDYSDPGARITGALRSPEVEGLPVDTNSLGFHYVVYSYRDSRGRVSESVSRRILVVPTCEPPEFLCSAGSFCSINVSQS
jgi:hypothetical protein